MSDLIEKEIILDALDEIESEVADGDGFQYEKWRQYFCELPSAPDRCDTCRFVYYPKEINNNDQ